MKQDLQLDSFGEMTIHGFCWHDPQVTARGVIVICHGMAEHIERYHHFATYLTERGLVVYGYNQRGHGSTAGPPNVLGDMGDNGWIKAREDLRQAIQRAKSERPGLPLFLLGHSMGSYLVRDLLTTLTLATQPRNHRGKRYRVQKQGVDIDGVILSGTGYPDPWTLRMGKWLASFEMKWKGPLFPSKRLFKLSFGGYNRRIPEPGCFFDWLSRDQAQVQRYQEDPWCGQVHSCRFYRDFAHHLRRVLTEEQGLSSDTGGVKELVAAKEKERHLLLLAGEEDPVGSYGAGVFRTQEVYRQQGWQAKPILYPGARHETLNEINRLEVYEDVIRWLEERLSPTHLKG